MSRVAKATLTSRLSAAALRAATAERIHAAEANFGLTLPPQVAHGAFLAAFIAAGRFPAFAAQLEAALDAEVSPCWLRESVLQSYLFVGFPRTWTAFKHLRVALAARGETNPPAVEVHDLGARLEHGPSIAPLIAEWWERGEALCRRIYGPQYQRLRENLGGYHPELADWMILEGYGKVLSRPEIDPGERELWILPILIVQDARDQLHSHLKGALRVGVPHATLSAVFDLVSAVAAPSASLFARRLLVRLGA
ncbi:MAG: carboxymuconolactone decarboxylase family protein [Candidatus Eisenbacteria bacterium]|nr:carboxymuconolactone decarboxylase family protein [Candidatus Eisenbacteria bacterium]